MNKEEIVSILHSLDLDQGEYLVTAGSAFVLYGLREDTRDIDLWGSAFLFEKLSRHYPVEDYKETKRILLKEDVELFLHPLDEFVYIDAIPVQEIHALLAYKEKLGRDKDKKDVESIKRYLDEKQFNG